MNRDARCLNEFEKKDLLVVDLIHFLSNKQVVSIIFDDGNEVETLFEGRIEDITFTADGCLHDVALLKVSWFESSTIGTLLIYTEEKENNNDER